MAKITPIMESDLREHLSYDPATGILLWIKSPGGKARLGRAVGTRQKHKGGYLTFGFRRRRLQAHRVCFFLYWGRWPRDMLDHLNGEPWDNRIANLREADGFLNAQNQRHPSTASTSGFLGVTKKGNRWQAQIKSNRAYVYLGLFSTATEASEAYIAAKRKLHAGCTI